MIITGKNVHKTIGGKPILVDVSFQINKGNKIGCIGRNGEGKTTLLDIIAGIEGVDSGNIFTPKNTKIAYAKQFVTSENTQTINDYLLQEFTDLQIRADELHMYEQKIAEGADARILQVYGNKLEQFIADGGYTIENEIARVLGGLGLKSKQFTAWDKLSGGEKTRASLARVLLRQVDILLLDEPTNHLDMEAVRWLASFVKAYRGTIVVVSHDRYFLDEIATHIYELEDKELSIYPTNYTKYLELKEAKMLEQFNLYKNQQLKIKAMKKAIKQLRAWAAQGDNEKMFRRAKSMEKSLAKIEVLNDPSSVKKLADVQFIAGNRSGKQAIAFKDVWMEFGEKLLFSDLTFQINYGDRVAITGANGTGKSTIIKLLIGELTPTIGDVQLGESVTYAYLSQQMEEINEEHSVLEVFKEKVHVTEYDARHLLAKYLFYGDKVYQKVKYLSGGELMRLRLAWFVQQPVNMLIFDEPTNHLDIPAREMLEEQITTFKGTVIMVSHDRYFIDKTCSKVLAIANQTVRLHDGTYSEIMP